MPRCGASAGLVLAEQRPTLQGPKAAGRSPRAPCCACAARNLRAARWFDVSQRFWSAKRIMPHWRAPWAPAISKPPPSSKPRRSSSVPRPEWDVRSRLCSCKLATRPDSPDPRRLPYCLMTQDTLTDVKQHALSEEELVRVAVVLAQGALFVTPTLPLFARRPAGATACRLSLPQPDCHLSPGCVATRTWGARGASRGSSCRLHRFERAVLTLRRAQGWRQTRHTTDSTVLGGHTLEAGARGSWGPGARGGRGRGAQ